MDVRDYGPEMESPLARSSSCAHPATGDADHWKFAPVAGQLYRIQVRHLSGEPPNDAVLTLYGRDGVT